MESATVLLMRLLGAVGALLVGGVLLAGCVIQPTGPLLCQDPAAICDCQDASNRGGVVVRWRIVDSSVGQLLDRGECCCNPDAAPGGMLPQQCGRNGDQCKDAPAWLVRNVRLHIKSITIPDTTAAVDCTIVAPCQDGELTTPYCLQAGTYDLQLSAAIDVASPAMGQFVCSNTRTVSPPAVRRTVRPGQAVNLDGIVLGVNAPPISLGSGSTFDGGTGD